jgi:hypothetical protein
MPFTRREQMKRIGFIIWLALLLTMIVLLIRPVSTNLTRFGMIACLFALWSGALLLFWNVKFVRVAFFAIALLASALLLLPGKEIDSMMLRQEYVDSLTQYEGTKYVWGGENKRGIDCSGLIRRGLIDADFKQGLTTVNPYLVRAGGSLWFHDCSARGLLNGDRQQTRDIVVAQSINKLGHSAILPGDIAVTADGLHTLAYIGDQTWIEADPNLGGVVKVKVPALDNYYFNVPIHIMRWGQFEHGN